ncbi:GntR family transcriptional regulator [Catenisphaera adipataccumulans]|uniref:DNA-binding transcriptional regulator YhcF (GntR family) n=1 Tax=Catenisphaera adipataccumulans TaxID=700500 RepID=A0A7W8CZ57_9FIRM|nr:GntR family transcriptional regulator [Catenisphaera adipataccumulans]MBB5182987.1 DNA-binding transcriptional regulator YhcF (GntR family) [Catenisphaera adipataccumulans]
MTWKLDPDRPIYLQIIDRIQTDIVTGVYPPGGQLPSVRALALEAGVNPNTLQKAMSELERSGLVESHRTSGRFVTTDEEKIRRLKESLVKQEIQTLLKKLKIYGLTKAELIEYIERNEEEQ